MISRLVRLIPGTSSYIGSPLQPDVTLFRAVSFFNFFFYTATKNMNLDKILNKENITENVEESNSSFNPFLLDYNSKFYTVIKKTDMIYKYYPEANVISKYDPTNNGWCGYSCIARAVLGMPYLVADTAGFAVRSTMRNYMVAHKSQFVEFFGLERYQKNLDMLTAPVDDSHNWWFTTPDGIWIAVITFKVPLLVSGHGFRMRIPFLYSPPNNTSFKNVNFFLLIQRHFHLLAYELASYSYDKKHRPKEQDSVDKIFCSE